VVTEEAPKSSYELAMERLRKKDKEEGVAERTLTDEQKAQIADIRRASEAKLAEREILHQGDRLKARDEEGLQKLDEEYRRDRDRITSERDRKIEAVRGQ
jgi:hypothetical protein